MGRNIPGITGVAPSSAGPLPSPRLDDVQRSAGTPSAEDVEAACRAAYGKHWDGPPDKMPGEGMKKVWRDYATKFLGAALADRATAIRSAENTAYRRAAEYHDAEVRRVQAGWEENKGAYSRAGGTLFVADLVKWHQQSAAAIRSLMTKQVGR